MNTHIKHAAMFSLFALLSFNYGCGLGRYDLYMNRNPSPDKTPATTLEEARQNILDGYAQFASDFYKAQFRENPNIPENAYFAAAFELKEHPEAFSLPGIKDFEPGHVLAELKKAQEEVKTHLEQQSNLESILASGLMTEFEPFKLGTTGTSPYSSEYWFDRAGLYSFAVDIKAWRSMNQTLASINLDKVSDFDQALEEIYRKIYKEDASCSEAARKDHREVSLKCANQAIAQGLELLHEPRKAPAIGSLFTVSDQDRENIKLSYNSFLDSVSQAQNPSLKRKPFERHDQEFIVGELNQLMAPREDDDQSDNPLNFRQCLISQCDLKLTDKETRQQRIVKIDIPAFMRNFPKDLRVLFPEKVVYPDLGEDLEGVGEALKNLQLKDPTLGGLIPDGDLISKAIGTDEAGAVTVIFMLLTAWALPSDSMH